MSAIQHAHWEDERAAYLLDALDERERAEFERHLAICESCRSELGWLLPALDVLPASVDQLEPPPELRDRILAAIDGDRPPSKATTHPSLWSRLSARPALAGFATVAALAIGLAGGYALRGDDDNGDGPPPAAATTVPIKATAPAVEVDGKLVNHNGTWTLDVSQMPNLRPGDVYQVWMRNGKQLQPSILFVLSRDGTARVVLPDQTGSADEMLVTAEPSGGSRQPTSNPLVSATPQ